MPELPETETIARDLDRLIRDARIDSVSIARPDVLREVTPRELARRIAGTAILRCWRRAKLIVLDLDSSDRLVVQPRFTGALLVDDGTLPPGMLDYSTMAFQLADSRRLHYRDVRRLGTVSLMEQARWAKYSGNLGAEPLDPEFNPKQLSGILRGSKRVVKAVLMDQRALAGVGNIYANEALWRAGVDPSRPAGALVPEEVERLHREIVSVLEESIEARGTSFRDYRDATGQRGGFVEKLKAYGRGGEPCTRCGARLVETHAIDGRSTVFCARCQR